MSSCAIAQPQGGYWKVAIDEKFCTCLEIPRNPMSKPFVIKTTLDFSRSLLSRDKKCNTRYWIPKELFEDETIMMMHEKRYVVLSNQNKLYRNKNDIFRCLRLCYPTSRRMLLRNIARMFIESSFVEKDVAFIVDTPWYDFVYVYAITQFTFLQEHIHNISVAIQDANIKKIPGGGGLLKMMA